MDSFKGAPGRAVSHRRSTLQPLDGSRSETRRAHHRMVGVVLAIAALLVFATTLGNGFTDWDDPLYVTKNVFIEHLDGRNFRELVRIDGPFGGQWGPLTMLSLALDHAIWGKRALGYHLTNVLLHAITTLLLFALLRRILGRGDPDAGTLPAAVAAGLFAIHPVQVESVAWISERKNVLAMPLMLAAFLAWLRATDRGFNPFAWAMSLVLLTASLLAKTQALILPPLLLLHDWIERPHSTPHGSFPGITRNKRVALLLPMFALALGSGLITMKLQPAGNAKRLTGDLLGAVATAPTLVLGYLQDLLLPVNRAAILTPPVFHAPWQPVPLVAWGIVGGGMLAAFAVRRARPHLSFFSLWFLVALVPVLNLVPFPALAADRYLYWAAPGFFALAGLGACWLLGRLARRERILAVGLSGLMAACFIALTLQWAAVWKDSITLWTHAVRKAPQSAQARANLGFTLMDRQDFVAAEAQLVEAIRLDPDNVRARNHLGFTLYHLGKLDVAHQQLEEAIRRKPHETEVLTNLGVVELMLGRTQAAEERFREILRLDPNDMETRTRLASVFLKTGRLEEAARELRETIRQDPGNAKAQGTLGLALLGMGRLEEAERALREAARLNPRDPTTRSNLGIVLLGLGKTEQAEQELREALALHPGYANARHNLAVALIRQRRLDEAEREIRIVLGPDPRYVPGLFDLARIAALRGDRDEALASLSQLYDLGFSDAGRLRTDPDFASLRGDARFAPLLARMEKRGS